MMFAYYCEDIPSGKQFNLIVRGVFGYPFPPREDPEIVYSQIRMVYELGENHKHKMHMREIDKAQKKGILKMKALPFHETASVRFQEQFRQWVDKDENDNKDS